MKISILITSFNKENYIEECIRSCLKQDYTDKEIILMDNCSEDSSENIFDKYRTKIKIIKKKRISDFPAINQIDLIDKGLSNCSGEILCLLDGDDYFYENKLSIVNEKFKNNANLKIIFDLPLKKKKNNYLKFKNKKKFQKYIWPTIINTSSISIEKQFLIDALKNTFLNKYNLLEIDFRINVYSRNIKNNFTIIREPCTVYRQLNNSIMGNMKKYSNKWWKKRKQAHEFMQNIYLNNGLKYNNQLDFFLTNLINKII